MQQHKQISKTRLRKKNKSQKENPKPFLQFTQNYMHHTFSKDANMCEWPDGGLEGIQLGCVPMWARGGASGWEMEAVI